LRSLDRFCRGIRREAGRLILFAAVPTQTHPDEQDYQSHEHADGDHILESRLAMEKGREPPPDA
jgi:hypothetical protein